MTTIKYMIIQRDNLYLDLTEKYEVKAPSTIVVGEVVRVLLEEGGKENQEMKISGLIQNMTSVAL